MKNKILFKTFFLINYRGIKICLLNAFVEKQYYL